MRFFSSFSQPGAGWLWVAVISGLATIGVVVLALT
jgi:hypothetical protein